MRSVIPALFRASRAASKTCCSPGRHIHKSARKRGHNHSPFPHRSSIHVYGCIRVRMKRHSKASVSLLPDPIPSGLFRRSRFPSRCFPSQSVLCLPPPDGSCLFIRSIREAWQQNKTPSFSEGSQVKNMEEKYEEVSLVTSFIHPVVQ